MFELTHGGQVEGVFSPYQSRVVLIIRFEGLENSAGRIKELQGIADAWGVNHHRKERAAIAPGKPRDVAEGGVGAGSEIADQEGLAGSGAGGRRWWRAWSRGWAGNRLAGHFNGREAAVVAEGHSAHILELGRFSVLEAP